MIQCLLLYVVKFNGRLPTIRELKRAIGHLMRENAKRFCFFYVSLENFTNNNTALVYVAHSSYFSLKKKREKKTCYVACR